MALFSSSRPGIRGRVLTRFPARVLATSGLSVTKANGVYTFSNAWEDLAALTSVEVADQDNTFFLVYNSLTDTYRRLGVDVLLEDLLLGVGDSVVSIGDLSIVQGDILYGSAADTFARLAKSTSATHYLANTGTNNNPAWAQVNLANGVTGNLPVANLGSGSSASSSTYWRGDGVWATLATTPTVGDSLPGLLLNGLFDHDQRKAGASHAVSTTNVKTLDKWIASASGGGAFSVQRTAMSGLTGLTEFFSKFARLTVTTDDASIAAGDFYTLRQQIEGARIAQLAWGTSFARTATLRGWVRSSITPTVRLAIRNDATNRSYVTSYQMLAANTWEFVEFLIAADTGGTWNSGVGTFGASLSVGLGVGSTYHAPTAETWAASNYFGLAGGTNLIATNAATLDLGGFQIYPGDVRGTRLRWPDLAGEIVELRRFFQKSYDPEVTLGTTTITGERQFIPPVSASFDAILQELNPPMAGTPVVTVYSPVGGAADNVYNNGTAANVAAGVSITNVGQSAFAINTTTVDGQKLRYHYSAEYDFI